MSDELRILHLEDDPRDTELMIASLRDAGIKCEVVRVDSRDAFVAKLQDGRFDVIISDVSVPGFGGIEAQTVWQEVRPTVPFIFLSGTFGEEVAIERLKEGATDYVLKNWMDKLPTVVRRALREMQDRSGRQHAQSELQRLNAELESRVEERTQQLKAANDALAESERRFFDILDHSPAAIFLKDLDGRYSFVNRSFLDMAGKTRADIIGKTDHALFPPRLADMYRANDRQVLECGASLDFEEIGVEEDLQPRVFHSSKFVLRNAAGRPYAVCGILTDITERKRAEQAMSIARREADRANRAKSDFLSRMSHDLRTPLNAVLGFAQLLDMDNLSPDQRESVTQILEAGRHLLDLMNEVLDISRIESGNLSLSPEPVAVADIINQVVRLMRPLGTARHIDVRAAPSADDERFVRADRQRLNQILLNLMSNAIKYNRPGGTVTVSCDDAAGGRVRISITDTGVGIRPEKLALLFTPFERLGADQTGVEGTGLGLALSRGLAEAMGGRIGVASDVDRGSTFWIELERATAPAPEVGKSPETRTASASVDSVSGTILYIEDNASNVRLVERLLKQRRPAITLLHASDGTIGIDMALTHKPDLIFLDLHLPDTPGDEVLRRLWEDTRTRHIPVAVLTADATLSQSRRLIATGAKAYLTKPLDVSKMLALIDERLAP
ncbi:MAG TPA: response regulator [Vicinamibacterales bacterium]|nr:response regulator [Vicinamibacterales bacterium]